MDCFYVLNFEIIEVDLMLGEFLIKMLWLSNCFWGEFLKLKKNFILRINNEVCVVLNKN